MAHASNSDALGIMSVDDGLPAGSRSAEHQDMSTRGAWSFPIMEDWGQEYDDSTSEDSESFHAPHTILEMLHQVHLRDFPRLPVQVEPLEGDIRQEADLSTSDRGARKALQQIKMGHVDVVRLGSSIDTNSSPNQDYSGSAGPTTNVNKAPTTPKSSVGAPKRPCIFRRFIRKSLKCPFTQGHQDPKSNPPQPRPNHNWGNVYHMLYSRELGLCQGAGFSRSQQCNILCGTRIPACPTKLVEELPSRAYNGQFSKDGSLFVAAFQDKRIRIYDVHHGWRLRKNVTARMLRWTITDTALSPDGRLLLYSSITPMVHLVNVGSYADGIESMANVTEIHDSLPFSQMSDGSRFPPSFGIWSLAWSHNGREVVAGTSDSQQSICVFDLEERKTTVSVQGHADDVNAVAFLDDSPNVFVSGSDDALIKVWDCRTLGPQKKAPGVLVGHTEGVTHIDCKGDGRSLISNSKDQTIKLWDVRKLVSEKTLAKKRIQGLPHFHWDYRWNQYPGEGFAIKHPHDASVMTYRGHSVLKTLIRAYFSPEHTTAQRFIYTGSNTGSIHVYDIVTGDEVGRLQHHVAPVRECSWHPTDPLLVSVSWDGCVVKWEPKETCQTDQMLEIRRPIGDKLDY